jgi:Flp pilus assembly protein TadG
MPGRFPAPLPARARLLLRGRSRIGANRSSGGGQSLVEFALILPLLAILMMGLLEFALAFQATLGINRASQQAALLASEAGNTNGADCLILQQVETDIGPPNDRSNILEVQIQRTGPGGGTVYAKQTYDRGGTTSCTLNDGSVVSVPYTRTTNSYPDDQRCNVLDGCPAMTPARTTVDTIGIQIRYKHDWRTPLAAIMKLIDGTGPSGATWTFQKRNVFRMEPML